MREEEHRETEVREEKTSERYTNVVEGQKKII
jgi:hypothetical protein